MKKKLQSTTSKLLPIGAIGLLLIIWQLLCLWEVVPSFMLPSPVQVVQAFAGDFPLLMKHARITLAEAFLGLGLGIFIGLGAAIMMDAFDKVHKTLYPLLVLTQTVPTIAIAPLLVLWMGYDMAPKVMLIIIVTFFPVAVGMLEGFRGADVDTMNLLKAMGAGKWKIFVYVKWPAALGNFFASLKISVSYAVVGAVISEWLGGYEGLGVYMTRVRSAYSYDKMFAVIFLISAISLLLVWGVTVLRKKSMPWEYQLDNKT